METFGALGQSAAGGACPLGEKSAGAAYSRAPKDPSQAHPSLQQVIISEPALGRPPSGEAQMTHQDETETPTRPSLYDRLGGVYNIAPVVDNLIDHVVIDPRLHANPRGEEDAQRG